MAAPNPNAAQGVIKALNNVIKYAITLGAAASAGQAALFTGEEGGKAAAANAIHAA